LVKALFCHPLMTDAFAIDSRDSPAFTSDAALLVTRA
jgi:hypothetical protein